MPMVLRLHVAALCDGPSHRWGVTWVHECVDFPKHGETLMYSCQSVYRQRKPWYFQYILEILQSFFKQRIQADP